MSKTETKSPAYARDTRYHNRVCKFRDAEHRESYMQAEPSLVAIDNEDDAYMISAGYTLDEDFDVWQQGGEKIGEGVNNDAAALYEVIIPLQDRNPFYEMD